MYVRIRQLLAYASRAFHVVKMLCVSPAYELSVGLGFVTGRMREP
jgi:hypothetical protein